MTRTTGEESFYLTLGPGLPALPLLIAAVPGVPGVACTAVALLHGDLVGAGVLLLGTCTLAGLFLILADLRPQEAMVTHGELRCRYLRSTLVVPVADLVSVTRRGGLVTITYPDGEVILSAPFGTTSEMSRLEALVERHRGERSEQGDYGQGHD
ncbi:hypothetical protein [Arsenicicoccus dermatophilus]|uniref:hypothetical protein n=1 Tax=Arsenicicoccus dermatophilus TaxID=1076331 RepID=UPI001F4C86D6|nr:hypothetical protein [Arsenicicoccus dermatophilus]MCH8612449.1 hypothetical protein [Arsenicicoccus dermatophilus]